MSGTLENLGVVTKTMSKGPKKCRKPPKTTPNCKIAIMDLQIGVTQNGQKLSKTQKIMSRTLENLCLAVKSMRKGPKKI